MNNLNHAFQRTRMVTVAIMACGLAAATTATASGERNLCEKTARRTLHSCQSEAVSDYWLAVAVASNLTDFSDRMEARAEAWDDFREAWEFCHDQFDARIDLCDALDENLYDPEIDPANFNNPVQNPYFPLEPGTTYTYEGETDEGTETVVVEVTDETREILGIECIVVRDIVYLDGDPIEDTRDYYAPDNWGNVWYFGENSNEIEDGLVVGTEGSFIAGEDGAKPGIIMLSMPVVGMSYRQEWFLGEAEDAGTVLSLSETANVPYGTFENCLKTADFTPIEPDALEHKFYAPGVGFVREVKPETGEELVLIDVTVN